MQNTTADYKLEINKPSRSFECKITIGNNIYTNEDLVNLTLEYTQPQEGFAIGNTISQSLDLTLLNRGDIIYSTSQIKVEIGLKIGSTTEYILMGIFNIDDIEKTDYTSKFTAYDNMIKFETPYFSNLGDKPTLKQVVNELSKLTGVEFTGSLPDYNVSKLQGFTCREVLSYVASICGGNAFITRDGKFTIKSLSEVEKSIDGNNYFDYTREEVKYKVGQISCQVDENNILSKGSVGTDSMELGFENPWITETILTEIYNKLNGLSYLGYSMKWQGDISLDPYDIITVTDIKNVVRKIPILSQKISYTGGLTSEIGAKGETKNKNSFSSSGSTTNKVNRLVTEQAVIKEALIEKANIKDLEAVSIRTQNLEAKTAKIEEAIIGVAHIEDLNAINANIEKLIAADATINNALIGKADITELNAVKGTINVLESDTANIKNLLAGNISGESGQLIHLTASNVVIADAVIKNLIASNISVEDLKASRISTNKFTISSDDGGITIVGPTMQFKDKNNKVRIQMGQDATGNFNFILRGEDGTTTLIDHTGIKEKAIADDLIKSNMVAEDAIGEKQINYSSLISGLNKDTNTSLIKASKVAIDLTGQSLDVAFNSLKSNVDNMEIGGRNLLTGTSKDYKEVVMGVWHYQIAKKTLTQLGLNVGDTVTFRLYLKNESDTYKIGARLTCYKNDGSTSLKNIVATDINVSSEGYSTVQVTIPAETVYLFVGVGRSNGASNAPKFNFQYKEPMLEKGNKPTNYIPAPEDVDSSIESVKQITESNSTTINVMQGQIATAINNTQIVKDGQTILLKDDYNRTVSLVNSINSTIGTHTTKINELTGSISSVDTKVNSVQRDLEGTKSIVSSHTSQISGLNSTVSTQGTSISQLQNQIALKVEKSDITNAINNINIGVGNLIKGSKYFTIGSTRDKGFINSGSYSISKDSDGFSIATKSQSGLTSNNIPSLYSSYVTCSPGDTFTVSVWFKVKDVNAWDIKNPFIFEGYDTNGTRVQYEDVSITNSKTNKPIVNNDEWCYITYTGLITNSSVVKMGVRLTLFRNGEISFKKLKIEKGNKATDWSPAYEDVDSSIANIQTQVTTTNNKVATIETNLSSITQRVSSTESTVSTHTSQLSTVDSRINTAKNSAISTAASDATSKANNALTSAKSYTDGQITTVNQTINTKVAEIKATTDSITSRVSSTESKVSTIETTTEKMLINNFSRSGNMNRWAASNTTIRSSDVVGNYADVNTSNNISIISDEFEIDPTKTYKISLMVQNPSEDGTGSWYFGVYAYDKNRKNIGVYVGTSSSLNTNPYFHEEQKAKKNTSWRNFESYIYGSTTAVDSNTPKGNCLRFMKFASNTKYLKIRFLNFRSSPTFGDGASGSIYFAQPTISEVDNRIVNTETRLSSAEQKITPTAITTTISSVITGGTGSISTTQFVMDKNGLAIKNGALTIQNKVGTTVFTSDTDGNLVITGTLKSQKGDMFVSLNSGGISFQDHQKQEQMLRIATTAFSDNRDINGITFAMPQYSDFIRFAHISKADLTNGWTSSDVQYKYFDCWSSNQTVGGASYKKGLTVYAPMYIENELYINSTNGIKLKNTTSSTSDIKPSLTWNTIDGLLGVYGDNGVLLGYKNGETYQTRLILTEGAHPGTGDHIKSYGNWNLSGYTIHNGTFAGSFVNTYANEVTRTAAQTFGIEAEETQVRVVFEGVQLTNGKAILNIPNKYNGIFTGYTIASIVKKGKGDVWVSEEQENRFIIEADNDIKINIELIVKL